MAQGACGPEAVTLYVVGSWPSSSGAGAGHGGGVKVRDIENLQVSNSHLKMGRRMKVPLLMKRVLMVYLGKEICPQK